MILRAFILICMLSPFIGVAQPIYNLTSNMEVDDCEGFFLDSDASQTSDNYAHGENYVFTICVPSAEYIEMIFTEFETEFGFDVLTVYDGPDTLSPVIGEYSGFGSLPPAITTTGNCLTIHWISDEAGVAGSGWNAFWQVEITEPEPPEITFNPAQPTCSTTVVQVIFDTPINCDSVYPAAVFISGEVGQTVTAITPVNCSNGEATTFELTLSPGLNESGNYHLDYTYYYTDECDNEYVLEVDGDLSVTDCPLDVDLFLDDMSICQGECTDIWAEVTGGDPNTYSFAWNPPLPNSAGPHQVCPNATQVYTLTVSDAAGSTPSTEQISLTVIPPPTLTPQGPVCEQDAPFQLTGNPVGGEWSGSHTNDDDQLFHPDSGSGTPWTYYTSPQGCTDSIQITVQEIWAGFDQASCPGMAAFQLQGFTPAGGTWSGTNVSIAGIFDPVVIGTFTLTYTATNGCTDEIEVNVDGINLPAVSPVCESDDPFDLTFSPYGGTWSGLGITNPQNGTFDPENAGGGIHTLTYTINGCSETLDLEVIAIFAGYNFSACPAEVPFQLNGTPAGGNWSGLAVSPTGMYDASLVPDLTNDTLTYTINGCSDTRIGYVRVTEILDAQLEFCSYDDAYYLDWAGTHRYPGGGNWSGPGTDNIDAGHFSPSLAGPGNHWIFYEANTCVDSILMIVHDNQMNDTTICESASAFILPVIPAGGNWFGDGIIDELTGSFDPQVANIGLHTVYYESPFGCWDSLTVDVYDLEPALIIGLLSNYCYLDTNIVLTGTPYGGAFSGSGMTDSVFNPLQAGDGLHSIEYTQGVGECAVQISEFVNVSDPISTQGFADQTICPGEPATIGLTANGGSGSNFTYVWEPDVTWLSEVETFPEESTTYQVITWDGCSQPDTVFLQVNVEPEIELTVTTSEPQCQGEIGNATIVAGPNTNYNIIWDTDPPSANTSIIAPVGHTYSVTVTDPIFGCSKDTAIFIPSYSNVTANFTLNPNQGCIGESDPTAEFLDLSEGGVIGNWDFGDGTSESYQFGVYPIHTYPDTGHFPVTLTIENAASTCLDIFEFEVCIQPEFHFFVPSAFTPDGDGLNDLFEIVSSGVVEFQMEVLSRWGHVMFTMDSLDAPWWDGTFRGNAVPEDHYVWSVVVKGRHLGGFKFEKSSGTVMVLRNN